MKVLVLFLLVNFVLGLTAASRTSSSRTDAVRRLPLLGLCLMTAALFSRYRWV